MNGIERAADAWMMTSRFHWSDWNALGIDRWLNTTAEAEVAAALGQPTHVLRFEDLAHYVRGTMASALSFIGAFVLNPRTVFLQSQLN